MWLVAVCTIDRDWSVFLVGPVPIRRASCVKVRRESTLCVTLWRPLACTNRQMAVDIFLSLKECGSVIMCISIGKHYCVMTNRCVYIVTGMFFVFSLSLTWKCTTMFCFVLTGTSAITYRYLSHSISRTQLSPELVTPEKEISKIESYNFSAPQNLSACITCLNSSANCIYVHLSLLELNITNTIIAQA
jgi:hypothetical protein